MKILKLRHPYIEKTLVGFIRKCPYCECKFEYTPKEIRHGHINCPCCNNVLIHNTKLCQTVYETKEIKVNEEQ